MHDPTESPKRWEPSRTEWAPAAKTRQQLLPWIDVETVGAEGFWVWLESILPVLPVPEAGAFGARVASAPPEVRLREIARALADCARERARLTIAAAHFYQDNFILALRVKALEAGLAQLDRGRPQPTVPADEESRAAAEQYLSRGG